MAQRNNSPSVTQQIAQSLGVSPDKMPPSVLDQIIRIGQGPQVSSVPSILDRIRPGHALNNILAQPAFNAFPEPRSYAEEYRDTLQTQLQFAPQIFASEQQFRPQYAQLDYDIYSAMLPQYLQTQLQVAPLQADIASTLRTAERTSDVADVLQLGPAALEAIRLANPEAASLLDEMTRQANDEVRMGMRLSPSEERQVVQNTRAGYADRGLAMSNPAIFSEVMNLDAYGRARQNERRGFAGDVLGYHKSWYGDPWMQILGRGSSNLGFAQGGTQLPSAAQVGPQLFNPESSYAQALNAQNYSGALTQGTTLAGIGQDYWNTIFNANMAREIALINQQTALAGGQMALDGQIAGGLLGAGGSVLGGFIGSCWIARAAYGENNPRWLLFRRWLLTKAPSKFVAWYFRYGPSIGAKLSAAPESSRAAVRAWMDNILKSEVRHAV